MLARKAVEGAVPVLNPFEAGLRPHGESAAALLGKVGRVQAVMERDLLESAARQQLRPDRPAHRTRPTNRAGSTLGLRTFTSRFVVPPRFRSSLSALLVSKNHTYNSEEC